MLQFMPGLKRLHLSMRQAGTERARFPIQHGAVAFDCLFLTDLTPFEFVLAAVGHPDQVFVFPVLRGYRIDTQMAPEDYSALARLLNQGAYSRTPFQPSAFLTRIDAAIPAHFAQTQPVTTADVIRGYRHHVEESAKVYFKGWLRNPDGKKPKPGNLAKTRRCFGQQVHDGCERQRISSCWSDQPAEAVAYTPPPMDNTP